MNTLYTLQIHVVLIMYVCVYVCVCECTNECLSVFNIHILWQGDIGRLRKNGGQKIDLISLLLNKFS